MNFYLYWAWAFCARARIYKKRGLYKRINARQAALLHQMSIGAKVDEWEERETTRLVPHPYGTKPFTRGRDLQSLTP